MFFGWNERTFRWFTEASGWTGYDREMAKLLMPLLTDCQTICDIGCGMAFVDFELSPSFQSITCIDLSKEVLTNVGERIQKQQITNISLVCGNGADPSSWEVLSRGNEGQEGLADDPSRFQPQGAWDAVLALFQGDLDEVAERYLSYAKKKLILVVHGSRFGTTGPKKYRIRKCWDVDHTVRVLNEKGIPFQLTETELEFGQPHRSFEEALEYFRVYTKDAPEEELIAFAREQAKETGREDFPLYSPKKRSFGIFVIEKN